MRAGKFELWEADITPKPDEVLVKVAVCGLCNWELNHWKGILGECPQPLGHEWSGTIVELGKDVTDFKIGDNVTGLADSLTGFSDYIVSRSNRCFKLSPDKKVEHALGEPLKCILTVLRATAPEAGEAGVIMGCGAMGLWCIQGLAGNLLSSLIAIDVDDRKLELARSFGATHTINPKKENVKALIDQFTGGSMADFVIEGTGIPALLNESVRYLKSSGRGRLLAMSSHEAICEEFDFREAISRSIEIRFPHPGYSYNQIEDLRRAVLHINRGVFKMDQIITHQFPLANIQEAFETFEKKPDGYIKGVVIP